MIERPTAADGARSRQSSLLPDAVLSRALDLGAGLVLLLFLSPVFAGVAIAIWVFDPGPVIFAHRRVGRGGVTFPCFKFRSMYVGAEARLARVLAEDPARRREWERDHKLRNDPRITPLGRILRYTSLDELPQLINVLRGEMSLVGPRPIVPDEIPRYGRFIMAYLLVRPGLTGLWQISGRSQTTYRRRVAADVLYVRSKSVGHDLRILVATIPAVILARGSV
jgi:exopolysaccharide production protein ExoY